MSKKQQPFCCRCKEDFPVAPEQIAWAMGFLKPLRKAPKKIQAKFGEWLKSELHGEGYLCGNCYFDLTDDADG